MTELPAAVERRVLLRSLLVQGSWNYETLIGTGFAFTLIPVLRHLHASDPGAFRAAVARHTSVFNSHPYLATVAAGAVARLESDGADPQIIERFKSAMRGSLGALGDRLVWSSWRPATALLCLVLLLAGAAWWVAVTLFLLLYNLLHLGVRVWGWRVGARFGADVARALRDAPLQSLASRAGDAGAFLGGAALVLAAAPLSPDPVAIGAALVATVAGISLGVQARRLAAPVLGLVWVLALLYGWIG